MTGGGKEEVTGGSAYRSAGVDIDAQDRALAGIGELVTSTFTDGVLSEMGSFGGLFRLGSKHDDPVLVASADGVGTKLVVAKMAGDFSTVGIDLVNHCVDDILVQGARPLFFLDYVGAGTLEPEALRELVSGLAAACRENGCALLGGETAEMPGFYRPGDYELVGFVVGLVERDRILGPHRVRPGDRLVGIPSSGLHTNGYSLARKVLFDRLGLGIGDSFPGLGGLTVGEALLTPHRSYLGAVEGLLDDEGLKAMAHVTGGGLTDNLPRALPEGTGAVVRLGSWEVPRVFRVIQEGGEVDSREMLRVFNMGIGLVLVVASDAEDRIVSRLLSAEEAPVLLGEVVEGGDGVRYEGGW